MTSAPKAQAKGIKTYAERPRTKKPEKNHLKLRQCKCTNAVANNAQLGWRIQPFASALDISLATMWRRVKAGDIRVVKIGGVTLVPRGEAVRLGLIES